MITKAKVTKILTENGVCVGVTYVKGGKEYNEYGPVVISTGGYGADFGEGSYLKKYRPELLDLSTTNGAHCDGSGVRMAEAIGAMLKDMDKV